MKTKRRTAPSSKLLIEAAELRKKLVLARARAATTAAVAKEAKADFKQAKKAHKQAKKNAKSARKAVKMLERELAAKKPRRSKRVRKAKPAARTAVIVAPSVMPDATEPMVAAMAASGERTPPAANG